MMTKTTRPPVTSINGPHFRPDDQPDECWHCGERVRLTRTSGRPRGGGPRFWCCEYCGATLAARTSDRDPR